MIERVSTYDIGARRHVKGWKKDDKKVGWWYSYLVLPDGDRRIHTKLFYVDGRVVERKVFYPEGEIFEHSVLVDRDRTHQKVYHENGLLKEEYTFKNGSVPFTYDTTASIQYFGNFLMLYKDGSRYVEETYNDDGRRDGLSRYCYHLNGQNVERLFIDL